MEQWIFLLLEEQRHTATYGIMGQLPKILLTLMQESTPLS